MISRRRYVGVLLLAGTGGVFYMALASNDSGDAPSSIGYRSSASCHIYLAESTIPNAGLGIYTSKSHNVGDNIDTLSDIIIPYGVFEENEMDLTGGQLSNFNWAGGINTSHVTMPPFEGTKHLEVVPGLGALPNHHSYYKNYAIDLTYTDDGSGERKGRAVDRFDMSRPHSGTDAYTPFQDAPISVEADMPIGSEIFANYGDGYFLTREGFYQEVPLTNNYNEANDIMQLFSSHLKKKSHPSGKTFPPNLIEDLWHVIRTSATKRTKNALWKDINVVLNHNDEEDFVPDPPTRSQEWLQEYGSCLDHLRTGVSGIFEAGRGAFARRSLSKGEVISPVPVMQMNRTLNLHERRIHPKERLLINYCFGHSNSTMILCPYVTGAALINHNKEKINAKIRPSNHAFFNKGWLERSARSLIDNFEPLGTVFEIVATRDIEEGEEVFLDYGDAWQKAWDQHRSTWENEYVKPVVSTEDVEPILPCIAIYLEPLTIPQCIRNMTLEQRSQTESLDNACFYYPRQTTDNEWSTVHFWTYSSPDGRQSVGGLFPCQILARQEDATYFTAIIEIGEGQRNLVRDVPITAIRQVTKKWLAIDERREHYRKDLSLPEPFRHPVELPDDVFPSNWMDLNF